MTSQFAGTKNSYKKECQMRCVFSSQSVVDVFLVGLFSVFHCCLQECWLCWASCSRNPQRWTTHLRRVRWAHGFAGSMLCGAIHRAKNAVLRANFVRRFAQHRLSAFVDFSSQSRWFPFKVIFTESSRLPKLYLLIRSQFLKQDENRFLQYNPIKLVT